jgi:outer membrane protein assembly factor BamB
MKRILFVLALVAAVAGNALAYEFHWPGDQYATNVAEFADGSLALISERDYGPIYLARLAPELLWYRFVTDDSGKITLVPMPGGTMLVLTSTGHVRFYATNGDLILDRFYPDFYFTDGTVGSDGFISVVGYTERPDRAFIAQLDESGNLRWINWEPIGWSDILALADGGVCATAKTHINEQLFSRFTNEGEQVWEKSFQVEGQLQHNVDLALSENGVLAVSGVFTYTAFVAGFDIETGEELWPRLDFPSEQGTPNVLFSIASLGQEFLAVGELIDPYSAGITDAWIVRVSEGGELLESRPVSGPGDRNYTLRDVTARSSGHYTAVGAAYTFTDAWSDVDCLIMQIPGPSQIPGTDLLARQEQKGKKK